MTKKFYKVMRKTVAVTAASAIAVSSLAGCGSGSGKKSGEPTVITIFSERANYSGEQAGWGAQLFLEEFNVKLNIVPNTGGAFDTRMADGNLGDIIIFGSENDYKQARDAGLLFNWEEDDVLADYGSYIKDNMSHALEKNRAMNPDGNIYGLGYQVATSSEDIQSFFYTWDIRWDLYMQLGHPEVNDLDDLLQLFKDMKEICPTDESGAPTYAVSLWPDWDGDMVMYVKSTATTFYGYDEAGVGLYDPQTGKFHGVFDDDSPYLEMLKFYNDLYRADLLDPDSMTATYDTMIEKVKKGGTFFSIFNYAGSDAFNTPAHLAEGKMMRSLTPTEASPIVYGLNVLGGNNYFAIGSKTADPELCMEILNYMCTPTGRLNVEYGPKGVTWDYDEDGNTYFTELGLQCINDKSTQLNGEGGYTGTFKDGELQLNCLTWDRDAVNPESNGETYNQKEWKSNQKGAENEVDQDWRDFTGCESINQYMASGNYVVSPGSAYVIGDKTDELKTTWAQVTGCITEYSWKAIYAKTDDEYNTLVEEMRAKAMSYGYQDCLDWCVNEAANRKAAEDAVSN